MSRHPITWRTISAGNVQAPDFRGASATMDSARQSMGDSMSGIQNVLGARQQVEQDNRENEIGNNTDRFLNTLQQRYQSPEQMAQAQASGEIDALRQEFGAHGLDSDQTGAGAVSDLISGRREDVLQDQRYADTQQQRGNRDALNQFETRLARGELEDAQGILENTDFQNRGELEGRLQGAIQDREQRDREQTFNNAITGAIEDTQGQHRFNQQEFGQWFEQNNLPGTPDNPDIDAMSDEQLEMLSQVGQQFGDANSTLGLRQLEQSLRQQNFTEEEIQQAVSMADEGMQRGTELSSVDQERFEEQDQELRRQYRIDQNNIHHMRQNDTPTSQQARTVVDNNWDKLEDFGGGTFNNREGAVEFVAEAMGRGLDIGGERVPIDEHTMGLILQGTKTRNWFMDGNIDNRAEEVLGAIGYEDDLRRYNDYQREYRNLEDAAHMRGQDGPNPRGIAQAANRRRQSRQRIRGNLESGFQREVDSRRPETQQETDDRLQELVQQRGGDGLSPEERNELNQRLSDNFRRSMQDFRRSMQDTWNDAVDDPERTRSLIEGLKRSRY